MLDTWMNDDPSDKLRENISLPPNFNFSISLDPRMKNITWKQRTSIFLSCNPLKPFFDEFFTPIKIKMTSCLAKASFVGFFRERGKDLSSLGRSLSTHLSPPPTHLEFKPRHLRVSHFWGWQTFLSHQGERSTTHLTRLHRSAQENHFSLFLFFSLTS
ncbi:hypothetical protein AMTRI_Chr09g14170 [Amborella trichopoda]